MDEVEEGDVWGGRRHNLGSSTGHVLPLIVMLQLLLVQVVQSGLEDPDDGDGVLW
jgi:hypothetical protein